MGRNFIENIRQDNQKTEMDPCFLGFKEQVVLDRDNDLQMTFIMNHNFLCHLLAQLYQGNIDLIQNRGGKNLIQ